ncbi:hypothetical protein [Polyangium aurulentum]|uniref:hypothetical protein n=1 Tax=Polyangium aurulentum TaxID=2567896 RepID=UPI0010ADBDBC|nr:hypothetical protein [Polyangium aurulentum]UQA61809.1 hypothetical protein E8A73_015580 [Polyangium aurulentum]
MPARHYALAVLPLAFLYACAAGPDPQSTGTGSASSGTASSSGGASGGEGGGGAGGSGGTGGVGGMGGGGAGGMGGGAALAAWSHAYPQLRPAHPLVHGSGEAVLVGFLPGPQDFGTGPVGAGGVNNVFVVKVGPKGETIWAKAFPANTSYAQVFATVSRAGHVVVVGDYWGELSFGAPLGCMNGPGMPDAFMAVLGQDGAPVYSRCFESPGVAQIFGAGVDGLGRVVIAGNFLVPNGTVAAPVTPVQEGGLAMAAFTPTGQFAWSRSIIAPGASVSGLEVSASGDVLLHANGSTIDLCGGCPLGNAGETNLFVAKYDAKGGNLWGRAIKIAPPGPPAAAIWGAALDVAGNAVITGPLTGTIDVGTGPISEPLAGLFIAKYDASGKPMWVRHTGGGYFRAVATDATDNLLLAGEILAGMDLGSGALTTAGGSDLLVAKLDPSGATLWAQTYGDKDAQAGFAIGAGDDGAPIVAGTFDGALDFGQGALPPGPTFLARLSPPSK